MTHGIILIKILEECWVKDFLDGNIYMNTNVHFTEIESSDTVRHDVHEGISAALQVKELSIANAQGEWVPIGGILNPVIQRKPNQEKINILCLYTLSNFGNEVFDERNLNFGSAAIIVKDPKEFIFRMSQAAKLNDKKLYQGPITYVPKESYHGEMGPFKKFENFLFQQEFRFVLTNGTGRPCTLKIGDIRDITLVCPSRDIARIPKN